MSAWPMTRFGELAEFRNGVNYTAEHRGPGIKSFNVKDFQDRSTPDYADLEELTPGIVPQQALLKQHDILFVRSNGNRQLIGRSMYLNTPPPEPTTHSAFTIRARLKDHTRVEPRFYAYYCRSKAIRLALSAHGGGTNIANLNQEILFSLQVPLPPIEIQRRIADILSAYDDLIEVNRHRITILEEMARRLFEEWFVRFRYPGHEDDVLAGGPLRQAPSTWAIVPASALIEFDPRTQVPRDGEKPFVPMSALSTNSMVIEGVETRSGNSGSKFIQGDTLFARITPCAENGKTGFVDFLDEGQLAFGSTEFIVMRGREAGPHFVYCLARSQRFRDVAIRSMAGADGRQRVRNEAVSGFLIPRPPAPLMEEFERFSAPMFAQVRVLANQNSRLRAARDLLLPKLISGEIDGSAAHAPDEVAKDAA